MCRPAKRAVGICQWLVLLSLVPTTDALVSMAFSPRQRFAHLAPAYASSDVASAEASESEITPSASKGGNGGLTFIAETVVKSDPVPTCSADKMLKFMDMEENLACLVTAGDKNPYQLVGDPSDELVSDWQKLAIELEGAEPTSSDRVLKVKTGGIQLPGLKLTSEAVIGAKVVTSENSKDFPYYEFCLIADTNTVEGPKPLVAIFNTLTGANKKEKKKGGSPTSLTRVSVETGEEGKIMFQTKGFLKIAVKFPTFLFRILPVSKEKAEQQGSEAVEKAIVRDTEAATEYFRNKYEEWISAQ
mmetsp:Transcript_4822/g.6743  ORF Transcript_4822/g.6743 Transcript_4822/m.6743 type:complete len:302 (-) Transcript_4822:85-990(-)